MALISKSSYLELIRQIKPARCLAVSKTRSVAEVIAIYNYGQRDFAENYAKELQLKSEQLSGYDISWHFTGRIQSNKCKLIARYADWVHSVTNEEQLLSLGHHRPQHLGPLSCFLQVIPDGFQHDYAIPISEVSRYLVDYDNIQIRGLMVMPAPGLSEQDIASIFTTVSEHAKKIMPRPELSMGMSNDYMLAVAAGATYIRLGRALFAINK